MEKVKGPHEFTREGVLHAVAQLITCDDQSLAVADKVMFRNCLVAMRPKTTIKDLPSTYDITMYIHNQFVERLQELKKEILVS
ncbi:hypothetical protein BJV78DRAFT_1144378 [Lactifluus subvellereus]|nr:hypothetical protein BJV78DRAFT_1144378 [Lactifluus subvellereus]